MKDVCVVTGGARGMGFAAAKELGKRYRVVLCDLRLEQLDESVKQLAACGIDAVPCACDVSDREAVKAMASFAGDQGTVKAVVHAAGVAPAFASWDKIVAVDAFGTLYVNEAFAGKMAEGGVIVNFSSSSPYLISDEMKPKRIYKLALSDVSAFEKEFLAFVESLPEERRDGASYPIAKSFVIWYTERLSLRLGKRGVRVVSIAPGVIDTALAQDPTSERLAAGSALGRKGTVEEVASVIDFLCSDSASYLTGLDLKIDGGEIASINASSEDR